MAFNIGSQFQLYVTHVEGEGPNMKVFGQIDKQRALMIESLLSASKDSLEGGLGQVLPPNIHVGMLCIAKYGDGDYYRAKVTSINDVSSGFVSVYFIDYGNNDVVHLTSIRFLNNFPDVFQCTPPQAKDFILARIAHPKGVWEANMPSSLNKLIYYEEISCVVEMTAFDKIFIKMIFKGQDLASYLTSRDFGVATTIQEQRDLLHKVLSSSKSGHHEPNRMYVPPPARLLVNDSSNRDAFRGYVPPQSQTTSDIGRSIGKYPQQARSKIRNVIPPRPLHRSMEDTPPPAAVQPHVSAPTSYTPTTYHSRHLKENESYLVHVSYAKDGPKCFAIQLKSDEEFLSNIVSKINSVEPLKLTEPPMIGSVCIGRFSEDKTLCRAVVLSSTESYCKLFFVDFGITENVLFSDIFQISEEDIKPHVFALRFSLSGIAKMQITDKIKNDFYSIVNNQVLTLKVVPAEGPPLIQYCELYLNGQCVKEMLIQKQNPTFRKIDPSIIVGEHLVLVSYVDSCTKFFIQISKNIDALNEVMDQVAAHCQEAQPLLYHQVRCGMSCCALFPDDQGWYRAIITNIKKDKITVNYVDYGNEQELTSDMLRPITPELITLSAQAIHCALKGFEDKPFDQRTCDSLEKLTLEKILSMNVHGVMEGGVLLVDLTDESTNPATFIASAVHDAAMRIPPAALSQSAPTPQEVFEVESTPNFTSTEYMDTPRENNSDTSFGSGRGNNDSYSSKPKKPFQERNRNDRNDRGSSRGNRDEGNDRGSSRGNRDDGNDRGFSRGNRDDGNDRGFSRGNREDKWDNREDTNSDSYNKSFRGEGGRRFSDRSNDKEFSTEKKSYGDDRKFNSERKPYREDRQYKTERSSYGDDYQSKPYKSRSYGSEEPPKTLQNPIPFDTSFSEPDIIVGQEYEVTVSWFINPNDFYVSLVSEENPFGSMMLNVPTLYAGVKPAFSHEVSVGSSVLARFPQDKALYRAQVLDSQYGGKMKVQFVDYGNKSMVDGSDIWQLESDLMVLPKMAIHCSLKGISPVKAEWTHNADIDNTFCSNSYKVVFHSKETDRYNVSLKNDTGDIGELLITKELAISTEKSTSSGVKTKVYITHVDSPGQFWLQCETHSEKVDELQESLQTADAFEDFTDIEVGKLCISKYSADEQFYRTIILDSDNDIVTVRFIDYGNTDVLDNVPGVLKCLPAELHDVEPYALKCSVNAVPTGTGQWTEQSSAVFTSFLGNLEEPIDAVFILKGATTYVDLFVNSVNITDQLVLEGHAARSEKSDQMPTCFASHVNSPSEFWIQLESSVHDLEAIAEQLINAEEFPLLNEIAEEVICAAKFPEDDLWYRAQIIIHGSDGTEVLFMDYGNASLTNELRSLPDSLKSLPALSRKCALQKSGSIKNWSKEAELKFADLAADGATIFQVSFIASGDTSIVELYIDGESVTKQLSALCHSENVTPSLSPAKTLVAPTEVLSPVVHICFSNSPEDFWIHHKSSTVSLDYINNGLEDVSNYNKIEDGITEGLICASVFPEDGLYYRSKVISHGEGGTEVFHIDFGSTALTDDLRELPVEIKEIQPLAIHCSLEMPHDRSKINEEMHNKFAEMVVDDSQEYYMEVINGECDPHIVRLFINDVNVLDALGFKFENEIANVSKSDELVEEGKSETIVLQDEVIQSVSENVQYEDMSVVQSCEKSVAAEMLETVNVETHAEYTYSSIVEDSTSMNQEYEYVKTITSENVNVNKSDVEIVATENVDLKTSDVEIFEPENVNVDTSDVKVVEPENVNVDTSDVIVVEPENVNVDTSDVKVVEPENVNVDTSDVIVVEPENVNVDTSDVKVVEPENVNVDTSDVKIVTSENIEVDTFNNVDEIAIDKDESNENAEILEDNDETNIEQEMMVEDEDRYSDVSDSSTTVDPVEEIKKCMANLDTADSDLNQDIKENMDRTESKSNCIQKGEGEDTDKTDTQTHSDSTTASNIELNENLHNNSGDAVNHTDAKSDIDVGCDQVINCKIVPADDNKNSSAVKVSNDEQNNIEPESVITTAVETQKDKVHSALENNNATVAE